MLDFTLIVSATPNLDIAEDFRTRVLAWSWGASSTFTPQYQQVEKAGMDVQDVSLTRYIDSLSATFARSCAETICIPRVELLCQSGVDVKKVLHMTLNDVFVSSVSMGGNSGEGELTENIAFSPTSLVLQTASQIVPGAVPGEFRWAAQPITQESE